jgi:hypothetical protein
MAGQLFWFVGDKLNKPLICMKVAATGRTKNPLQFSKGKSIQDYI